MATVVEYVQDNGANPFRRWFDRLNPQAAAKVTAALLRLEAGNTSNLKRVGPITECRINWGPGYRIYLATEGDELIILFGGGTKRRQEPDIARATALFAEYQRRRAADRQPQSKE
jgi:putative addiction module killer protein